MSHRPDHVHLRIACRRRYSSRTCRHPCGSLPAKRSATPWPPRPPSHQSMLSPGSCPSPPAPAKNFAHPAPRAIESFQAKSPNPQGKAFPASQQTMRERNFFFRAARTNSRAGFPPGESFTTPLPDPPGARDPSRSGSIPRKPRHFKTTNGRPDPADCTARESA